MRAFAVITISVLVCGAAVSQSIDPASATGYKTIRASDLQKNLYIIASDSMEGRETAMPGQHKAAAFIASQFKQIGLKPAGDNGTYFQHFDVRISNIDAEKSSLSFGGQSFTWGKDFLSLSQSDTSITAPIAFVGFVDSKVDPSLASKLAGHIVVTFAGTREAVQDTSPRGQMMRLFAARRDADAAAQLTIADASGDLAFSTIMDRVGRFLRGSTSLADQEPQQQRRGRGGLRVFVSSEIGERLLRSSGLTLDQLRTRAMADSVFEPVFLENVPLTVTNAMHNEIRQTENVLGVLEGSDPVLKNEYVAVTGHFDHLGKTPEGVVYYGADDDGSGTVTVIELAQAFASNRVRPKRSMLFMTVVGEEKGLLGSTYYTSHPVFPLEKTVADLNIDMIGRIGFDYMAANDSMYVYVIGSDKISPDLDSLLRRANDETSHLKLDYTYNDENDPNRFYYRSDHYNFAKNGVPVTFFFTGTHPDYHQPTDTPDKILYERMAMIARVVYETGWKVANRTQGLRKLQTPAR